MVVMLDSEETARRLGVTVRTVYAYVSRGHLTSHPSPDGRRSLFDDEEVKRLEGRPRGSKISGAQQQLTISSEITELGSGGPVYRGHAATTLATEVSFEEVASILWKAVDGTWDPFELETPPE